jgi:hypothetical protein
MYTKCVDYFGPPTDPDVPTYAPIGVGAIGVSFRIA